MIATVRSLLCPYSVEQFTSSTMSELRTYEWMKRSSICTNAIPPNSSSAEVILFFPHPCCSKMGYVNGKTDADLLIEEDPFEEDQERILILKVKSPS